METRPKFMLTMLLVLCSGLLSVAFADGPSEVVDIPAVVNVVDASDDSNVEEAIEKANEILGQANMRLAVVKTNNNVNVGNGDGNVTYAEGEQAVQDGQQEVQDTCQDKDGNWNGKGVKITVADDCWTQSGNTIGWCYHGIPVMVVEPDADANEMGATIAHELLHILTVSAHSNDVNDLMYPTSAGGTNISPNDINEIWDDAKKRGWPHWNVPVYPDRATPLPPGIEYQIDWLGADIDSFFDVMCADPGWFPDEPNYLYADLREIFLFCDHPEDTTGTTKLDISLGGDFPADSFFDVCYEVEFDTDSNGIGDRWIFIHIFSPGDEISSEASYQIGDACAVPLPPPEIRLNHRLDGQGGPIPGYHSLHLEFPTSMFEIQFFEPGSEPFEEIVYANVSTIAFDERLLVMPTMEDFTDGLISFRLSNPYVSTVVDMPDLHFVGVSGGGGGGVFGVYARGFPPDVPVSIRLDGEEIATTMSNPDGTVTPAFLDDNTLEDGTRACMLSAKVVDPVDPNITTYVNAMGYFVHCPNGRVEGDLDNDCDVDWFDFTKLAANWLAGK